MTSSVGTISTVTGVAPVQQPAATPAVPTAIASTVTAPPLTSPTPQPNQRIIFDPQAGLINEYLNSKGSIESQVPSAVVVAYLRAGLTAAGLPQQQTTSSGSTAIA